MSTLLTLVLLTRLTEGEGDEGDDNDDLSEDVSSTFGQRCLLYVVRVWMKLSTSSDMAKRHTAAFASARVRNLESTRYDLHFPDAVSDSRKRHPCTVKKIPA